MPAWVSSTQSLLHTTIISGVYEPWRIIIQLLIWKINSHLFKSHFIAPLFLNRTDWKTFNLFKRNQITFLQNKLQLYTLLMFAIQNITDSNDVCMNICMLNCKTFSFMHLFAYWIVFDKWPYKRHDYFISMN